MMYVVRKTIILTTTLDSHRNTCVLMFRARQHGMASLELMPIFWGLEPYTCRRIVCAGRSSLPYTHTLYHCLRYDFKAARFKYCPMVRDTCSSLPYTYAAVLSPMGGQACQILMVSWSLRSAIQPGKYAH